MKPKKKTASTPKPAAPAKKTHRASSPMLAALLPVLLGLLASLALLVQLERSTTAEQTAKQVSELAGSYQQQLGGLLDSISTHNKALSAHPALIRAILAQDTRSLTRLEQEWSHARHVISVVIMIPGNSVDPALGFAALDHLGVAATNQQSTLEYVISGNQRRFYQASPILHPQQPRVIGSLLVVHDAASMLGSLTAPGLDAAWQVRLHQQLPQAPQLELYQAGPGLHTSSTQTFRTAHPFWTLSAGVDTPALLDNPALPRYLALPLILLLSAVAALLILQGQWRKRLIADAERLAGALHTRTPSATGPLTTAELAPLADALQKHLQRSLTQAAASTAPAPGRAATPRAEAPLATPPARPFGLDDALEIDILDMELDESALQDMPDTAAPAGQPPAIDAGIFRAYDIRGIVGAGLDAESAYWIGRAIGSESIACGEARVVVGRDGRLSGPQLLEALTRGLTEAGCSVLDLGMVPTPVVYFGTHQLEATSGVVVTGSHNPPDYNGFKVVIAGETLSGERIRALHQRIVNRELLHGSGQVQQVELVESYIEHISADIAIGNPLKVVVDCGNGVAGVTAPRLLEALGCSVIALHCEVDGNFPNHHPDPGKPENLQDLIRTVQAESADLGLAFDGDGDRLGVVTNTGEIIYPDRLMMLLARDVVSRNPGCDILYDVKCTRRLAALISRCGGRPIMWKTGHSLMKAKLRETGALLAGEMSGHIFFKERWFGFDDGLYAAARLLEILSLDNDSADRVFARYPACPSTPELTIEVTEDSKFAIIEALENHADWGDGNVTTLDGIRVDYPRSWGLIRASNTTPMLVLRFEGENQDELQRVQNLFRDQLRAVAPDIHWPF